MSDDIVTRLREIADSEVYRADISVSKLYEAADEIERLRELLWKYEHCEMVCESPCDIDWEDGECETCDKHRKAVSDD